jgi:cytidine deaminase
MKKVNFDIEIHEMPIEAFVKEYKELYEAAKSACQNAYAPYSNFKVGCAMQLDNQQIIKGGNQENAAFPACTCAEGTALSVVSALFPDSKIEKIAITIENPNEPVAPCGICRQRFAEYELRMKKEFEYFLIGNENVFSFKGIKNLLPLSFTSF